MIRVKKTSRVDVEELASKQGAGFTFADYSIINTGNLCMIFEKKISDSETRYIVKIHTRVGLHRQCSFTAVDSRLVNAYLYRGELYAYLEDNDGNISLARLEPDTKEDLVAIEKGSVVSFASKEKDEFALGYEDGKVIRYVKGRPEVLEEAAEGLEADARGMVSFDCNERMMWMDISEGKIKRQMIASTDEFFMELEGVECFMISRDDREALIFKDGKIQKLKKVKKDEGIFFEEPEDVEGLEGEVCRMNKSTLAIFDGKIITVGTI